MPMVVEERRGARGTSPTTSPPEAPLPSRKVDVKGLRLQAIPEDMKSVVRSKSGIAGVTSPRPLDSALSPRGGSLSPTDNNAPVRRVTERSVLEENLRRFGFVEHPVDADGNCQFRSIAFSLFNNAEKHKEVRRAVMDHLRCNKETYSHFVEDSYCDFIDRMAQVGSWGDHITLQAAADHYVVLINVVTSHSFDEARSPGHRGGWLHRIRPKNKDKDVYPKHEIWLSYCEESFAEHYNPLTRPRK
eukprot:TRINITY_DN10613_c0_g1_i1.p1 TRINITY_DN10613_c0_g1~~TRINITY_DN10613_c0_g1_i1.p1  ORF type:complete len:256 (+),score=77.16 TRINITY_DN10613_c0_g1_i1:35-769(+)